MSHMLRREAPYRRRLRQSMSRLLTRGAATGAAPIRRTFNDAFHRKKIYPAGPVVH